MTKILYAEDNLSERKLIAHLLELSDFEVMVVNDGQEAVEAAQEWNPDLILMDLGMPNMDGLEATRTLRGIESTEHIPVIAVTAWDYSRFVDQVAEVGINHYLTKPIERSQLVAAIRRHLEG